jgi:CBS domain-containing protein
MTTISSILAKNGGKTVTIPPGRTIREALALLAQHNVGALIVVDGDGPPVGILSERDIVRHAVKDEAVFLRAVADLMTRNVITGVPGDELQSVATTMVERRVRHLPVMDRGKLVGMVSIGDVVRAQRDWYLGELDTLQVQLLADGPQGHA